MKTRKPLAATRLASHASPNTTSLFCALPRSIVIPEACNQGLRNKGPYHSPPSTKPVKEATRMAGQCCNNSVLIEPSSARQPRQICDTDKQGAQPGQQGQSVGAQCRVRVHDHDVIKERIDGRPGVRQQS